MGIGVFTKSVYAYNGIVPPPPGFLLGPGDTLTYRITTSLPFASFENGSHHRFPAVAVLRCDVDRRRPRWRRRAAAPRHRQGKWTIGPSDTFTTVPTVVHDVAPVVTTSAPANSIVWNYGTFNTQSPNEVADLLFTVTATTRPFADNLNIANLAQTSYQNSTTVTSLSATVTNITTKAPNVTIVKQILLPDIDTNCVAGAIPANYDAAVVELRCRRPDQLPAGADQLRPLARVQRAHRRQPGPAGERASIRRALLQTVTDSAGTPVATSGNLFDLTANGGLTITTIPADTNGVVDPNEVIWVNYQCTVSPLVPSSLVNTAVIDNTARLKYYSANPAQTTDAGYNYAANQAVPGSQRPACARDGARHPVDHQGHHRVEPPQTVAAHGHRPPTSTTARR